MANVNLSPGFVTWSQKEEPRGRDVKPFRVWFDTSVNIWKIRNTQNTDWWEMDLVTVNSPISIGFNSSGNKMFVLLSPANAIYQYSLSTAWDISTAFYSNKRLSLSIEDGYPRSFSFNSDGSSVYTIGLQYREIFLYNISDYDMDTGTYDEEFDDSLVSSQEIRPNSISVGDSDSKAYIVGVNNDIVYQYSLSPSGAEYDSINYDVGTQSTSPRSVRFKDDGSIMYILDSDEKKVFQYDLGTDWDVSTATYNSDYCDVSSQETYPYAMTFGNNGYQMYIAGLQYKKIIQYNLSTPWDVTTASYSGKSFIISAS